MSSSSTKEFVWCMDTMNKSSHHPPMDPNNPTNDVVVPLNMTINRITVESIELATLELPRAQRLIETQWNRFFVCDSIHFQTPEMQEHVLFNLMVRIGGVDFQAFVPNALNPIVHVDNSDPLMAVVTTKYPHLLQTHVTYWDWGEDLEILADDDVIPVSSNGVLLEGVTILSPTTFSIVGHVPSGYLQYPDIPSPAYLATMLCKELNASCYKIADAFNVTFDLEKGVFCLAISRHAEVILRDAVLVVSNVLSLSHYLGFGSSSSNLTFAKQTKPFYIYATEAPRPVSFVEVSPGNYTSVDLATEINYQFNKMYFEPIVGESTEQYRLQFGTNFGEIKTVYIPPGLYNPVTLAATLTNQFETVWPEGNIITEWHLEDHVFSISSLNHHNFSLECQPSSSTNIANRLGFEPIRYTTDTLYVSDTPVEVFWYYDSQNKVRYQSSLCTTTVNQKALKFSYNLSRPLGLSNLWTSCELKGTQAMISNKERAHGFQVGDIVNLNNKNVSGRFPVVLVSSGTEFVLDIGNSSFTKNTLNLNGLMFSAGLTSTSVVVGYNFPELALLDIVVFKGYPGKVIIIDPAQTTIEFSPNELPPEYKDRTFTITDFLLEPLNVYSNVVPKLNLMFSYKVCGLKSSILGFPALDLLWSGTDTYSSPFTYRLEAASYVLVQLMDPIGSARIEHYYKGDNKSNLLGKIVILPHPWLDRFYPMKSTFCTEIRLEQVHLRLLNPDHTLYQLHGHEWSATFRLNTIN
jgi:hypothetical protein